MKEQEYVLCKPHGKYLRGIIKLGNVGILCLTCYEDSYLNTNVRMVFTLAQMTVFFEEAVQMVITPATRPALALEGILMVDDLEDFTEDALKQVAYNNLLAQACRYHARSCKSPSTSPTDALRPWGKKSEAIEDCFNCD